jgi:hypothetical protein
MSAQKVNRVINSIEGDIESGEPDENESLASKFDSLGQEIIADSYDILMRAKKRGYRLSEDEDYMQTTKVKQFNIINSIFTKLKRQNRILDHPNENFDKELLQKIKEKRTTVPSIVRDLSQQ